MEDTSEKKQKELIEELHRKDEEIAGLRKKNEQLQKETDELKKERETLKEEIKQLKKPKWAKPNLNKGKDQRAKKKIGAKPGHKASPRKPITQQPDQTVVWVPEICLEGHGILPFPTKWHEHIQIDIPVIHNIIVTKHKVGWSYCKGCKKYHGAVHDKLSYTKYGAQLHAYVTYLKLDLGLTLGKIKRIISDQYGLMISTGVISEMISRTADGFKSEYEQLKKNLKNTSHLHADETGWRNGGNNEWLWSFSNKTISIYTIVPSRAQKVVKEVLGDSYGGVLISDFYGGYNKIICQKQRCWTHLLRELHVLKKKKPGDEEIEYFSNRLKKFFERACNLRENYTKGEDIDSSLKRLETDTIQFLSKTFQEKKLQTLVKRMTKFYCELYTFIKKNVEPTNNPAEREIRPAVLMRKTSYCNRSDQGRDNQAILMSIISTTKKNDRSFLTYASDRLKGWNLGE
jgi:transposase